MIQQKTITFLKSLSKNNNKAWFDAHRSAYDAAKIDFTEMVTNLLKAMSAFDKQLSGLQAKDCLFRINRDVRFSSDKRPYKTNLAAYINRDGKKAEGAGYYLHIEPGKSFMASGIWQPLPQNLAKIRQEIDYNLKEFEKIIHAAPFKKQFGKLSNENDLSRPPKGYNDDNPAIEHIKHRSFIITHKYTDKEVMHKDFVKNVAACFKVAKPLVDFINTSLE